MCSLAEELQSPNRQKSYQNDTAFYELERQGKQFGKGGRRTTYLPRLLLVLSPLLFWGLLVYSTKSTNGIYRTNIEEIDRVKAVLRAAPLIGKTSPHFTDPNQKSQC